MKNPIIYLSIITAALLISCSNEQEYPDLRQGGVNFETPLPSESSKVPTCKSGNPTTVLFEYTDIFGFKSIAVPAQVVNDRVRLFEPLMIAEGEVTFTKIAVMSANDTLYAIPSIDDLELANFANLTVPFTIQVVAQGNNLIQGTVFCLNKLDLELPEDQEVSTNFNTDRRQTMRVRIVGECITFITVTVNALRDDPIPVGEEKEFNIAVPLEYTSLIVRAYTDDSTNEVVSVAYRDIEPYNADGQPTPDDLVRLIYNCEI